MFKRIIEYDRVPVAAVRTWLVPNGERDAIRASEGELHYQTPIRNSAVRQYVRTRRETQYRGHDRRPAKIRPRGIERRGAELRQSAPLVRL